MVDELERTHARFIGLNLTYETREGFAKNHVRAGGVGRPRAELGFAADESPTLEVQLVGCADEIAYDSHDVDDGLAGGVLREEDLCVRRLCRDARAQVLAAHPELCRETSLRHRALVRRLIRMSVDDLLNETIRRLREKRVAALADVRACPEELVGFSKEFSFAKEELEKYLRGHFYSHPDVEANRRLWRSRLKQLFSAYLSDPRLLPSPYCARIVGAGKRDASGESPLRVVCDYVGGMTDRYAENRWREICGEPA
jgi:dGTPase